MENFFVHMVRMTDTLPGLALKYHTSVSEIKKLNKITHNNDVYGYAEIKIPRNPNVVIHAEMETEEDISLKRKQLTNRLIKTHNIPIEVARYYLELNEYDFMKATQEFIDDVEWEKKLT